MEEASINVCNNKHLDPEHELSEDDIIKDMLEYNNNNIELHAFQLYLTNSYLQKINWK